MFGDLKPGLFRRWLTVFLLWLLDYSARHIYNRGYLTRVQTIHFARWVFVDDRRRLFFASNYDGSVESYMDDFINKVAWGINLVFSNGIGYPRTDWLITRGARDEQKYKRVLRRHQLPTDVWYKAYPGLTVVDLERNSRIREGIERTFDDRQGGKGMASPLVKERASRGRRAAPRSERLRCKDGALESMEPSVAAGPAAVDFGDMQGLVRFGHGKLSEACFFLLEVADRDAACRWLLSAPVTSAEKTDPRPTTALQVAFTCEGLRGARRRRRGRSRASPTSSSSGMAGEAEPLAPSRRRRRQRRPRSWDWGGARPRAASPGDGLCRAGRARGMAAGDQGRRLGPGVSRARAILPTFEMGDVEPFGFADGVSQPHARLGAHPARRQGARRLRQPDRARRGRARLSQRVRALYGTAADRPDARSARARPAAGRGRAGPARPRAQRQLSGVPPAASGRPRASGSSSTGRRTADAEERERLAAAMVGRTREGQPLAPLTHDWIEGVGTSHEEVAANHFTYAGDPHGERCPFGAHIRRANPRTGDMPAGTRACGAASCACSGSSAPRSATT